MASVALQIISGAPLTPLASPLPFFAYPFFAAALIGLAFVHWRDSGEEKGDRLKHRPEPRFGEPLEEAQEVP